MNRAPEGKIEDWRLDYALTLPLPARTKFGILLSYCCSVAAVAACTWLGFRLNFEVASVGFLYLIVVVVSAVYGNFWQATVTSIIVVACLDYFFVPPLFRFTINDPRDWLALGTFEFTALMLSHLSRRAQMRTAQAIVERQNSDRLYQLAQRILLLDRSQDPDTFLPPMVREVFGLSTVALFDAVSASTHLEGNNFPNAEELASNAYYRDKEEFDSDAEMWSCPLRVRARPVGGLAMCGGKLTPLIAAAIASLSSIAIERARSFERENRAEAASQVEHLRSAVLDALAHQIKTPLTVIRTASSGLLAAGGLAGPQTELVTLIDDQVQELNQLTSHLLGAARLDGARLEPQREPLLLSGIVEDALETVDEQSRSRFQVSIPDHEPRVWADHKLIETALAQLIDNAAKYSDPGSPIAIEVAAGKADVTVTVRDRGLVIAPADRERIFERFYRGAGSERRSAGTGLGLSIVRKIVAAHQGHVWAESDPKDGTAFFLTLPAAEEQRTPPDTGRAPAALS